MGEYENDSVKLVAPEGDQALQDRFDTEKWLIYCPAIASDTLLLFITQGESYSLRYYGGHLWNNPDAPRPTNVTGFHAENLHTTTEFREALKPETVMTADYLELAVHKTAQWEKVIAGRWSDYERKHLQEQ